jgi:hypothetical protein
MNYLSILDWNVLPHLDLEDDIRTQKNGLFTITIRLNNGNIVDYNLTEYVDPISKYGINKGIVITEFSVTRTDRTGGTGNEVGNDNV